jgi:hypothetical protein
VLHEKGVPNVGLHAFQLFYSPCQMYVITRTNMPTLISNIIFPNREGLERLNKFMPRRKSMSGQIPNFQDTQEEDV